MSQGPRSRVAGLRTNTSIGKTQHKDDEVIDIEMNAMRLSRKKSKKNVTKMDSETEDEEPKAEHVDLIDFIEVLEQGIKERQRKNRMLRGLCFYNLFIATLLLIVFLQRDIGGSYWMNNALNDALFDEELPETMNGHWKKNFKEVQSVPEIWDWIEGVLLPNLESSQKPNGDTLNETDWGRVYMSNRLVGGVRLRQIRVKPVECYRMSRQFRKTFDGMCYPEYSEEVSDTAPFGPDGIYTHSSSEETKAVWVWGRMYTSLSGYTGGGYVQDLPHPSVGPEWVDAVASLKANNWLDEASRALIITLNFFNPNVNHYDTLHIVFELGPGGSVSGFVQYKVFKLDLYVVSLDYFRAGCEVTFILILFYFVWQEIDEISSLYDKNVGLTSVAPYFKSGWNILDWLNIILFVTMVVMQVLYIVDPNRLSLDFNTKAFVSHLEGLALHYTNIYNVTSFNLLLSFLKIFKYLQFNSRMQLLWRTLDRALPDLYLFLAFFFIVLAGFRFMGYILFGPQLWSFHDFVSAISTMLRMSLGELEYSSFLDVNRSLAPVFTLLFVVLVFFVLINIFLAIINDAYSVIHQEAKQESSVLDDVTKENFSRLWNRFRRRDATLSNKRIVKELQALKNNKEGLPTGPDALEKAVDMICVGAFNRPEEKERVMSVLQHELKIRPPKKRRQDIREMKKKKLEFLLKMYQLSDFEKIHWFNENMDIVREYDLDLTSTPPTAGVGTPPLLDDTALYGSNGSLTNSPLGPRKLSMPSGASFPGPSITTPPPVSSTDTHIMRGQLREMQTRMDRIDAKLDALLNAAGTRLPGQTM